MMPSPGKPPGAAHTCAPRWCQQMSASLARGCVHQAVQLSREGGMPNMPLPLHRRPLQPCRETPMPGQQSMAQVENGAREMC